MAQSIRQLNAEESEFGSTAAALPGSWQDAVAHYLAGRKTNIVAGIESVNTFALEERRSHAKALEEIASLLGTIVPKAEAQAPPQRADAWDAKMHHLARLLTPPGWYEKWGFKLKEKEQEVTEKIITGEEAGRNQALLDELLRLNRFLTHVERHGVATLRSKHAGPKRRTG